MGFRFSLNPTYAPVMPAHSRSQNGVALLAYVASLHVLRRRTKSWMAGTSPAITAREFCAGKRENISSSTRRRIVAVLVTYRFKSRLIGRGPDACRVAGRGRCPRADLQTAHPQPHRCFLSFKFNVLVRRMPADDSLVSHSSANGPRALAPPPTHRPAPDFGQRRKHTFNRSHMRHRGVTKI